MIRDVHVKDDIVYRFIGGPELLAYVDADLVDVVREIVEKNGGRIPVDPRHRMIRSKPVKQGVETASTEPEASQETGDGFRGST